MVPVSARTASRPAGRNTFRYRNTHGITRLHTLTPNQPPDNLQDVVGSACLRAPSTASVQVRQKHVWVKRLRAYTLTSNPLANHLSDVVYGGRVRVLALPKHCVQAGLPTTHTGNKYALTSNFLTCYRIWWMVAVSACLPSRSTAPSVDNNTQYIPVGKQAHPNAQPPGTLQDVVDGGCVRMLALRQHCVQVGPPGGQEGGLRGDDAEPGRPAQPRAWLHHGLQLGGGHPLDRVHLGLRRSEDRRGVRDARKGPGTRWSKHVAGSSGGVGFQEEDTHLIASTWRCVMRGAGPRTSRWSEAAVLRVPALVQASRVTRASRKRTCVRRARYRSVSCTAPAGLHGTVVGVPLRPRARLPACCASPS